MNNHHHHNSTKVTIEDAYLFARQVEGHTETNTLTFSTGILRGSYKCVYIYIYIYI